VEGGDVLALARGVLAVGVGVGERTSAAGAEALARSAFADGLAHTVLAVPIAQRRSPDAAVLRWSVRGAVAGLGDAAWSSVPLRRERDRATSGPDARLGRHRAGVWPGRGCGLAVPSW
jgi:hypothetical protein